MKIKIKKNKELNFEKISKKRLVQRNYFYFLQKFFKL